ncbi:MAG: hypothetical protein K8S99_16015 [Planctomycetes bacterium]|nr:hypothetical protein [Planctomycetota bacterium]
MRHKRWFTPFALTSIAILGSLCVGCGKSPSQEVHGISATAPGPDRSGHSGVKTNASDEGLTEALRDIEALKKTLRAKSPEELIGSFIPDSNINRYGGYEYYYNYMANDEIRRELQSRGGAAEPALRKHADDPTWIWEAVNGPAETIGHICNELLRSLVTPTTRPSI